MLSNLLSWMGSVATIGALEEEISVEILFSSPELLLLELLLLDLLLLRKDGFCEVKRASLFSSIMGLTTTGSRSTDMPRPMLEVEANLLAASSSLELELLEDCIKDGRMREEDLTSVDLTMMGAFTSEALLLLLLLLEALLLLFLVRMLDVKVATGATGTILASSTVEAEEEEEVESFLATSGCCVAIPMLTSVISLKLIT